jgi:hypothetical protein
MINAKISKNTPKESTEERLLKLLEGIDWKLWEMYNMMKDNLPAKEKTAGVKTTSKIVKKSEE